VQCHHAFHLRVGGLGVMWRGGGRAALRAPLMATPAAAAAPAAAAGGGPGAPPSGGAISDEIQRSTNPISLTRFLLAERSQFKEASGSFAMLLQSLALACKVHHTHTNTAPCSRRTLASCSPCACFISCYVCVCQVISNATRRAGLSNLFGAATSGSANTSGDQQKKLDVIANEVMINCLAYSVRGAATWRRRASLPPASRSR
jgi:hypothetical protein